MDTDTTKNIKNIYDIKIYTDAELLNILDLSDPTDAVLEAKILSLIGKYSQYNNQDGQNLKKFYEDVYNHFFYEEPVQEGFENKREQEPEKEPEKEPKPPANDRTIGYTVPLDYSKDGKLNPLLKQTTKRLIVIDSQYRDNRNTSSSTDFTFNLNDILKDVVSLKFYSFQIPYTWYVVNSDYGSNFFKLKGISSGINNGNFDISVNIPVGNYNASGLINALNTSIQNLQTDSYYSDISFGTTNAIYNPISCKTTLNFDIKNTFNENYYQIGFQNWTTPYDTSTNRITTIPSFLGFSKQNYDCNIIYSNRRILPLIQNSLLSDNTIGAYYLDNSNNYFNIVQYVSTTPDVTYSSQNITILNTITIKLNLEIQVHYTRTLLVNELNTQLQNSQYLINSGINRVDVTDISFNGNYYSHYEMKILLNRNTTVNNIPNQKVAIVFPNDNIIWTGKNSAFIFDNQINELSNITSEQTSLATEFYLTKYPAIFLKCVKPFYGYYVSEDLSKNYSTLNNYTIYVNGLSLNGCSINEYINAINSSIIVTNNTSISKYNNYLGDFKISDSYATINASNNFQLNLNLNKIFTQDGLQITNIMFETGITAQQYLTATTIPNTDLYTVLNLFHEYLDNGSQNIVVDLTKNVFTSTIPYSSSGFTFSVNRLFTIMPKTQSGLGTDNFPPFDINFNGSLTVPHTFYNITEMANYLTGQLTIKQFYDSQNNYYGSLEQYNMLEGSYVTCDFSGNNIVVTLKIVFNSYITENDFELVFVDENVANIPEPPFNSYCRKVKPYFTSQNVTAKRTNNNSINSSNLVYGYPFKYISMGVDDTTNCQLQYSNPNTFTTWNKVIDLQNVMNTTITGQCYDFAGMSVSNFYFQHINFIAVGGSSDYGGNSFAYSISNGLTTDSNQWIGYNPSTFKLSTVYCVDTLFDYDNQEFILIICGVDNITKHDTIYYSNPITTDISSTTFVLTNSTVNCFVSDLNSITTPVCYKWASNSYSSDYGNIGSTLVACGFSDQNTIGYSTDKGQTWIGVGTSLLSAAYDVAWNGNQFIACGIGKSRFKNLASSPDGQNWSAIPFYCPIEQSVNSISCNGNTWVIGGTGINTLAYSLDNGATWTGLYNFTFTDTVYSVQYFNVIYKDPKNGIYDVNGIYYPNTTTRNMWMAGGKGNNTVAFSDDGIHWNANFQYGVWNTEDPLNSWGYNLKIPQNVYDISSIRNPTTPYVTIDGSGQILDANITLNDANNKIYLNPISIANGGNGLYTSDNTNSIVISIPSGTYTTTSLINKINGLFTTTLTNNGQNLANGSAFSIVNINNQAYTQIRLNINKIYSARDYQLIFYDPTITTLVNTANQQLVVATWDSTLGWLLGYRSQILYNLSDYIGSSNIATIIGDTVVSINLYNYFMIVLNDYNQNHLNDGLITTTRSEFNVVTPSYVNIADYNCEPTTNNSTVSLLRAPPNSTGDNTNFSQNLTKNQMYAAQEILNTQNKLNTNSSPSYYFTNSPFAKDLFAIIPLKITGQQTNTVYVDYGGSLQNQERTYFGPVNISRMSIQLINDRGNVVDLNNSNWSFTLVCEQLYQYKKT